MIPLCDWIDGEKWNLTEFEQDWRRKNKENHELYPVALEPGEWLEQYMLWVESQKKPCSTV